jgi:hypothetical protein
MTRQSRIRSKINFQNKKMNEVMNAKLEAAMRKEEIKK